ncbi:MAG: mismatch-specific DNA-glycosylase [Alphaproteobacteria bacterium]|nr:mismatch-specific DNA-glycosylase [Alphaproteobacteria bacterium]
MGRVPQHILPEVLAADLRVVFRGSAAGFKSAQRGAYYAGPGNKFWPVLHRAGLTPRLIAPAEFRCVLEFGIGLTDLCKTGFGNDVDLDPAHDDVPGLLRKIKRYKPRVLAFTVKGPAAIVLRELGAGKAPPAYGLHDLTIGETRLFVLTSPSGRAGSFWDEKWWRELKKLADGHR